MSTRVFQGVDYTSGREIVEITLSPEDARLLADHLGLDGISGLGKFLHELAEEDAADDFSGEWPFLRRSEETQVVLAKSNPVASRDHKFKEHEQHQYNNLKAGGRTLYDNLRTQFNWDHATARDVAIREYGLKRVI